VKLPVIPTLRPSLSPIRTRKPLLFHLHTQGQLLLAAFFLSPHLLSRSPSTLLRASCSCCCSRCSCKSTRDRQTTTIRQANKSRCSLTAFRVCIRCLHISLRKTPHNGPSRYPSSSASLATWYALFFAKRFSSLHMSVRLHFLAQVHTTRRGAVTISPSPPMLSLPLSGPLPVVTTSRIV